MRRHVTHYDVIVMVNIVDDDALFRNDGTNYVIYAKYSVKKGFNSFIPYQCCEMIDNAYMFIISSLEIS